ncbi:hypothetical protein [Paenibacillus wynnii]|uniref:hypothetical protein n=1 Tax=Paenibacillus wynnii TaxID=268407 RepID=UPI002791521D|nr:hypothetical protein [Paenibacillus wynnii]MDQ0191892.1 hypothetical protein [Paenibacillus wynnii]
MSRRRRRRFNKSKKGSLEVILVLVAFVIYVVFSIIREIVTGIKNIEEYFLRQNAFSRSIAIRT